MKVRLLPQRHPHLPLRPLCLQKAKGPSRSSTLRSLGEPVTRLLPVRLRPALLWNCCATASFKIEWSQINLDSSSWHPPNFPQGIMS